MSNGDFSENALATQCQLTRLKAAIFILAILWIATVLWLVAVPRSVPPVLTVERLEIVEPDGSLAMVLANSQRPAVGTIGGQVILEGQEAERRMPSFIFFDGKGDEVGGMLFNTQDGEDGPGGFRQLSLDGYRQDQTVTLFHRQNPEGSRSGLSVMDRPDHSILDAMTELDLDAPVSREDLTEAMNALPDEDRAARLRELFGVSRVFLGSDQEDDATLVLMDGEGRARIVIETPREGMPSIQILDEGGEIVLSLPEP